MKGVIQYFCFCSLLILFCSVGRLSFAKVNLNETYQEIESKLRQNPNDINLQMDLAYLYTQGFEYERAIEIYKEVLQKDEHNIRAVNELCVLYTSLRNMQEAEQYCQQMVTINPQNYLAYDNLGLSYLKLGRYDEAFKPFLEAITLNKTSILVKYHLADVFMALKEWNTAKNLLEKLLLQKNLNADEQALLQYGLYLVYLKLGNYDSAYNSIVKTYKLTGNSLYLGKIISAFIKDNQFVVFMCLSIVLLWFCHYFGQRVNRFLKNE